MAKKGWYNESKRHSLARRGIKSAQRKVLTPIMLRQRAIDKKIDEMGNTDPLPFVADDKSVEHYPIETAVVIPSTQDGNKKISGAEFKQRIIDSQEELSDMFGGYTSIKAEGGWKPKNGKVIREDVVKIVVFTTPDKLKENQAKLDKWLTSKRKEWGQYSMGYEIEGDFYSLGGKEE
jgi:hypothetical protein